MGLFDRGEVALALKLGELVSRFDTLAARVDALERRDDRAPNAASLLTPRIQATISALAQRDPKLQRHLTEEASGMLAFASYSEDDIVQHLVRGSS